MRRKHRSNTVKRTPSFRSQARAKVARPGRPTKNLDDLPSWLVLGLLLVSAFWAGGGTLLLHDVGPGAWEVANRIPPSQWGGKGIFVVAFLLLMGLGVIAGKALALRCQAILVKRHLR